MSDKRWLVVTLVALAVLLAGCGGGEETPVGDTTAQASPAPGATRPPTDEPASESPQATVVDVINEVDADPLAEGEWQDAVVDMTIYTGGQVWAQESSTARVEAEEGLMRVAPNTIFTLERPGADVLQLTLDEGQVWVNVEGLEEGQTFQVETPAAVASVRGTRFGVRAASDGTTVVATRVGTVTVSAAGETVEVAAGLQTKIVPGDPPSVPGPMSPEEQIRWGMAAGSGLDVALPAVGVRDIVTYTGGYAYGAQCSPHYLALTRKDPDTREYWYEFSYLDTGEFFTVALPSDVRNFAVNPVDGRLAFGYESEICTMAPSDAGPSCFGGNASYSSPAWSPDGEWLVFSGSSYGPRDALDIFRANPDGSDLIQLTQVEERYNRSPVVSPDGSQIAYASVPPGYEDPADLVVIDAHSTVTTTLLSEAARPFANPVWSPDGSLLAVSAFGEGDYGAGGGLWMVRSDGSDAWKVPGTEGSTPYGLAWSPTPDGWPFFYRSYSEEQEQYQSWYVPGPAGGPMYFADIDWGPVWCAEGVLALFGFDGLNGAPWTAVYIFQTEPDFWP